MKTHALILVAGSLIQAVSAFGQAGEVVVISSPTVESSLSGLDAKLSQLLQQAEQQIKVMGDPNAIPSPTLTTVAETLGEAPVRLKTEDERRAEITALTGQEVFTEDAFGTMTAIGSTITRRDGTVVQRDPNLYKMDAAMMQQVNDYKQVREDALQRKEELMQVIAELTEEMNETKDIVMTAKLSTMINALNGQVADCNQIILVSQADAEMMDKEMLHTSRIVTKGEREKKQQFNKRPAPAAGAPATSPTPVVVGGNNANITGATPGTANGTNAFAPNLKWGTYSTKPPANTGGGAQNP